MAKNAKRPTLFERAMNLADRFFAGVDKINKAGDEARKQNIELIDEMYPGFKESHEKSMQKAAEIGSKLEGKTEKILFGRDMYWGAGGEARKAEAQHRSLDDQIQSASSRISEAHSTEKAPVKEPYTER